MQSITDLLSTNPFVIVIGTDFSKAFDTLRHDALHRKMAICWTSLTQSTTGWWTTSLDTNTVGLLVLEGQYHTRAALEG